MSTYSRPQLLSRLEGCRKLYRVSVFSELTCALRSASCLITAVLALSHLIDGSCTLPIHPFLRYQTN